MKRSIQEFARDENWSFRSFDVYTRGVLVNQPHPMRIVKLMPLFINRIGWFAIISSLSLVFGFAYIVFLRIENIIAGQIFQMRSGWIFIGAPILFIVISLIFGISFIRSLSSLRIGKIAIARVDALRVRKKNSVIEGDGDLIIYGDYRQFEGKLYDQTLTNEWMGQIVVGDYLLLLIHPRDNKILTILGPVTAEDAPFIRIALDGLSIDTEVSRAT